jgi:prepilin-type processing-associated H-X9-DG protein
LSNLRTLGLAASLCANDSKGKFPAGYTNVENGGVLSAFQFLAREGYFEKRWRQQLFNPAVRRQFSNLVTVDNYLGGYGWNEIDNRWRRYSLDEIAAPPRTIMAADAYFILPNSFDWLLGTVLGFFPNTLSKGSAHYLFYDGHVQKLKAQNPGALNSPPVGYPDSVRFTNQ